jgi:hypothetical protein
MNDCDMIEASGMLPDLRHKKSAHLSAAWSFSSAAEVKIAIPTADLTPYRYLTFSAFAVNGEGGSFHLQFESGEGGYACLLPVERNGWNDYRVELPFLQSIGNPAGWDHIRSVNLNCVKGAQANRLETVLSFDNFYGWEQSAPECYLTRAELKGAALFSKNAPYALVDRKRIPNAIDCDSDARPFESGGILWIPMAPIAAALGHKAVADNKAYSLSFIYRRTSYSFYGNSDKYLVGGEEQALPFRPMVRAGTLFFPVGFVKDFFHWRQLYADPCGLVLLSNRKNAFDSERDAATLWGLGSVMTLQIPDPIEILNDLHKKIPNPDKGRLLLLPEEWMEKRKAAKLDAELGQMLRLAKISFGAKSEEFLAAPIFDATDAGKQGISAACNRLLSFSLLYRMTGEKPYALRAYAEAKALANLPDWNFGEKSLLTACGIGLAVSLTYDWCHTAWSEGEKATVERALLRYLMRPGVDCYNGRGQMWRQGGADAAEINCSLTAAALALADIYPETARKILAHSLRNAASCFEAYAPDGGYAEGLNTWERATRYLALLIAMLDSACGKDYGLASLPGFSATARFAIMAETPAGAWNYHAAEAAPVNTSVFGWFGKKYGKKAAQWIRRRDLLAGKKAVDILDFIWYTPADDNYSPELALDAVYRNAGVVMLRSGWGEQDTFLALHGGSNRTFGGELDAGSFILEMGGVRFFGELSPSDDPIRRRAEYQNTIVINPDTKTVADQNPDASAPITEARSLPERAFATVDMTATADELLRAKRGILLTENRTVAVVQDELTLRESGEVLRTAYTSAEVEQVNGKTLILRQDGVALLCKLSGAGNSRFEISDLNDGEATRISVRVSVKDKLRMAIACKLLNDPTERSEKLYDNTPMSNWEI